jgi:hypothetical protein
MNNKEVHINRSCAYSQGPDLESRLSVVKFDEEGKKD